MSLFAINSSPFFMNSFYNDDSDEEEMMMPMQFHTPSRSFRHPWFFNHPSTFQPTTARAKSPCKHEEPSFSHPKKAAKYQPRLKKKQSVTEQGIPIQIHHEEATADDDLIPNKKINKNDLANAPRNTEKLEPMITDFETQALENERENSEGVVSSRDEENHVNVKQNDPEKKNSDEQPMTQKKESGSEATDDSEDEDRSKWDESPTLDYILIEAEKQFTNVLGNLEELVSEIKSFSGSRKEKTFLRLEHELTNKLLRLDGITAAGSPSENEIRAKRKEAVTRVQEALDILEDRVTS